MTVAELATTHPAATRVLYRHQIEFCAGASRRVADACREAGLDVGALLAEVEREESAAAPPEPWSNRPLAVLVDHIKSSFHDREQFEMGRLHELLRDESAEFAGRPEFDALSGVYQAFRQDLLEHMLKEETVLFPWIQSGRGDLARTPIQVMLMEHEATLRLMNQLRDSNIAFARSASTSESAHTICAALESLDRHVREHMHLENNILFPRALRGED